MTAAEADVLKNEGNEWFKVCKFQKAIDSYTRALEIAQTPVLYSNRAFAYIKSECPGAALADADSAIALDPDFIKAYYRKASAHLELGKHKEALKDFRHVCALVPNDSDAKAKMTQCEKEVRRIKFALAIASEATETMVSKFTKGFDKLVVSPSYDGPVMVDGKLDLQFVKGMMERFKSEKLIAKRDLIFLLLQAEKLQRELPNFVPVTIPEDQEITVCGDTHGQYYDLLNIFEMNGLPSDTNRYLFNGDFVDRGSYSLETVTVLLAFKVLFPEYVFLSRGNHEGDGMNRVYGFEGEVKAKYDVDTFQLYSEVFNTLPYGHILNDQVFVTHGGLHSEDGVTIADLQKPNRFRQVPESGILCESLWSDPQPMRGRGVSKRGVGCSFGPDVTENFLKTNNLKLVVRSHEVKDDGYVVEHDGKCITVFSAPNYCDQIGNQGAFIRFNGAEMKPKFTTYGHVKHPGKKPMCYSSAMGMM